MYRCVDFLSIETKFEAMKEKNVTENDIFIELKNIIQAVKELSLVPLLSFNEVYKKYSPYTQKADFIIIESVEKEQRRKSDIPTIKKKKSEETIHDDLESKDTRHKDAQPIPVDQTKRRIRKKYVPLRARAYDRVIKKDVYAKVSVDRPKDWFFKISPSFEKSLRKIGDKKKEGRILGALIDVCNNPIEVIGNSQIPLKGNLKGKWRHRIGNYRLVYQPDRDERVVSFLLVSSRGGVYD